MAEFKYEIVKKLEELSCSDNGYTKELNLVSWNNRDAKIDIRIWNHDEDKCGKGISLTDDEAKLLLDGLNEYFNNK